jgi:hypothetical protein
MNRGERAEPYLWLKRSHEKSSRPLQNTQHDKQKHRTKGGHKNAAQQAAAGEAGEATEELTADQGADDSDHQIADQPEATAFDQHASQPAITPTSRNQRTFMSIDLARNRGDDLPQDQEAGQSLLAILTSLAIIRHECESERR